MNGHPDVHQLVLSSLVPHSYRCRAELLIEFPNKHPFMQKALVSKVNSTKGFVGLSSQETCITHLAANSFRIHNNTSSIQSHHLAILEWWVPTPCFAACELMSHLLDSHLPSTHPQVKNRNKIKY